MTHITPAVYGLWAMMSVLLSAFCAYHLWHYDRFRCLRWDNPRSGVFKRFMTYTYILSLPTLAAFAIGNAVIKYQEGFIYIAGYGVVPKPYQLWSKQHERSIFPLLMVMSFAWALEMITHLEELCFWLFLTNTRSAQQDWFRSKFFYIWMIGSVCAITYMPVTTALGRDDPLKCEAWTFLAGSLGSLTLTVLFMPVLVIFPSFLRNLEAQGVDQATVVRLTGFQELNRVRVVFRLMFTGAFLVLGADGVRPHHHVNESMFWTDFLAMIGAFGCSISSALTIVIFFPRSAVTEYMVSRSKQMATSIIPGQTMELREEPRQFVTSTQSSVFPTKAMAFASDDDEPPAYVTDLAPRGRDQAPRTRARDGNGRGIHPAVSIYTPPPSRGRDFNQNVRTADPPLRPNRREDIESGGDGRSPTSQVLLPISANHRQSRPRRGSSGGNSAKNWLRNIRSPIDMMQ